MGWFHGSSLCGCFLRDQLVGQLQDECAPLPEAHKAEGEWLGRGGMLSLAAACGYVGGKQHQTLHPCEWMKECFEEKQLVCVGKGNIGSLLFFCFFDVLSSILVTHWT